MVAAQEAGNLFVFYFSIEHCFFEHSPVSFFLLHGITPIQSAF